MFQMAGQTNDNFAKKADTVANVAGTSGKLNM